MKSKAAKPKTKKLIRRKCGFGISPLPTSSCRQAGIDRTLQAAMPVQVREMLGSSRRVGLSAPLDD